MLSMESDYYYWINYIFVKVIGGYIKKSCKKAFRNVNTFNFYKYGLEGT